MWDLPNNMPGALEVTTRSIANQQDVFQPLAMRSSSFDQPKESVMPFSVNNWLDYTTVQDTLYPYNRENGGSNGLHSSAADIASWMYMLLSEVKTAKTTFVTQDVFKNFFSPQYRTGRQASIGFGWDIRRRRCLYKRQ
jgi:CubicO group peptidase (beta-lactamase class C family)